MAILPIINKNFNFGLIYYTFIKKELKALGIKMACSNIRYNNT